METSPSQNTTESTERDYQRYCHLLELWSRENSIKTQKLQYFLLTNALLIVGIALTSIESQESLHDAVIPVTSLIPIVGTALSLIWTLSLGRTILFQKRWGALMRELSEQYQRDSRFQILSAKPRTTNLSILVKITGAVSSKYYLIGGPLAGIAFWLWLFLRIGW